MVAAPRRIFTNKSSNCSRNNRKTDLPTHAHTQRDTTQLDSNNNNKGNHLCLCMQPFCTKQNDKFIRQIRHFLSTH